MDYKTKKRRPPTLLVRFLGRRKSLAGELVECLPTPVYCMYHQKSVPWGYNIPSHAHSGILLLNTRSSHFWHCPWPAIWISYVQEANWQSIDDAFTLCSVPPSRASFFWWHGVDNDNANLHTFYQTRAKKAKKDTLVRHFIKKTIKTLHSTCILSC